MPQEPKAARERFGFCFDYSGKMPNFKHKLVQHEKSIIHPLPGSAFAGVCAQGGASGN